MSAERMDGYIMNWLFDLYRTNPTAQAIATISLVCAAGMAMGCVKLRGIGLGTTAVLFAGILVGYVSKPIDHRTLEFVKEFGLILFVFCIGLQLGPGFFASLRQIGLRLNVLAVCVVALGALLATGLGWAFGFDNAAVLGVFSGATTNTPSLGAAQQALSELAGMSPQRAALPALAYAVTYPAAIIGILATVLGLKTLFRIDPPVEAAAFAAEQQKTIEPLVRRTLIVNNPDLEGVTIGSIPDRMKAAVAISRVKHRGEDHVHTAMSTTVLHRGDAILVVGTTPILDQVQRVVGTQSDEDLMAAQGAVTFRRVVVTNGSVLGKSVRELGLEHLFGVTVTRVTRADVEMTAVPDLRLQFGDVLQVVGDEEGLQKAAMLLGNSLKALNETHFLPLFAGIVTGIAVGTAPLAVPGMPQPLRLGLAGGPLIVAILLGRLGRIGRMIWHMPRNANMAFREFGIALFFASVGLMAGPQFFSVAFTSMGLWWLAAGVCVTVLPIMVVGAWALAAWRINFVLVSGLLAGSMTDPPALAFASKVCGTESPAVAYATVFPLTMMLRILTAQILAVVLCG